MGAGGRAVKSFDDSTSDDDGASERGMGEGDTGDSDQEFPGGMEPGWLEVGFEILGKLFFWDFLCTFLMYSLWFSGRIAFLITLLFLVGAVLLAQSEGGGGGYVDISEIFGGRTRRGWTE